MNTGPDQTTPNPVIARAAEQLVMPFKFTAKAYEYKIVPLRECQPADQMFLCDTPDLAAAYWRANVASNPLLNSDCECMAVLILNTRRRIKGHYIVSVGTLDTLLVHPREIFRLVIMVGGAAAIVLAHNHPSGDPQPSEADIKVTRELIRAGQLLKIEVLDHVIIGNPGHSSLRSLGYFY